LRSIAKGTNVSKIAELFGGGGHEVASAFRIDGSLRDKEDEILQKIREHQSGHSMKSEMPNSNPIEHKENPKIIEKSEIESTESTTPIDLKEEFKEDIETKW